MKKLIFTTLGLAALVGAAQASFTYTTPVNATSGGGAVDASAVFIMGNGTVTIDLSNLLAASQVKNVGQNVSDLFFTLDNQSSSGSVGSSSGTFINVGSGGSVNPTTVPGTDSMGWLLSYGLGQFHLNGLGATFTPAHTIIGGLEGSSTAYLNANSSITNLGGPHNPFAQGEADFVLNISGVNANTKVTAATFSFGTTAGDNVKAVPEPASMIALAVGAIGLMRRRKA